MQSSVRRAALSAGIILLLLLPACEKTPAESSDASSAPAASNVTSATRSITDMLPVPGKNSDGVQVNWNILPSPDPSVDTDDVNSVAFSTHYKLTFTPRDDYGALHTYTGVIKEGSYAYPVYGLLDAQLRILTPAVYDGISDSDSAEVWLLYGNTWKAEDDPRVKKIYAYDGQFEYLYQHIQVIARDGSWMLDDNYCFYTRITDGYMLFSIDGSLTLISEKGVVTAKLSGGDYCRVQPIEKGRLFAFHGLDGSVTVRDRTGKAVSHFTNEQIGDDVRYKAAMVAQPETELIWQGGIGYVQHHNEETGRDWITCYLYADTGEVKKPPVKGLIQDGYVEQERVEEPYVSEKVSVSDADVPKTVRSRTSYFAVRDRDTEQIFYYATDSDYGEGEEYNETIEWTVYDSAGRTVVPALKGDRGTLDSGYLKFVRYEQTGAYRADGGSAAYVTQYIRLSDGKNVFYYRAAPAESGM